MDMYWYWIILTQSIDKEIIYVETFYNRVKMCPDWDWNPGPFGFDCQCSTNEAILDNRIHLDKLLATTSGPQYYAAQQIKTQVKQHH